MAGHRRLRGVDETRAQVAVRNRRAAMQARMAEAHTPAEQLAAAVLYFRSRLALVRDPNAAATAVDQFVTACIAAADALPAGTPRQQKRAAS